MPWLAGGGLSALAALGVAPPAGHDVQVLQRFLVGAEVDPRAVVLAVEQAAASPPTAPQVPPDARGALLHTVERFFALLAEAYGDLHGPAATGDRATFDQRSEMWRERLDDAARHLEERGRVVRGEHQPAAATARRRRRQDHAGLAILYVALALTIAALMLWAVAHGWPVESVDFGV